MFRYVAFCWNRSSQVQAKSVLQLATRLKARSSGWRIAFCGPGIRVYTIDERVGASSSIPLQSGYGIVLGTLFEHADGTDQRVRRARTVDADESARIARTAGRRLIAEYWGRYVAFVQNRETGHLWIIRDPTGALPCLRFGIDGIQIFAAHIEDCCELAPSRFSIHWPYVRARLLEPYVQTAATGLTGVSQLLPGNCVELVDGKSNESTYWHPCHIAESHVVEDEAEAVERLRSVVTSCVQAWASCHKAILLKLSGGLDSAIVLGCLISASERPNVICANDYSQGSDTDERYYARLAAEQANCTLVERARDPTADLKRSLAFRRLSAPLPSHFWIQTHPTNEELAARNSATALFTGNGGDQLFLAGGSQWPLVDYLYCHGPHLRAVRIARDASYLQPPARCQSWWSLMRKGIDLGLLGGRKRKPFDALPDYSSQTIVNGDVIDALRSEYRSWLPPWLQGTFELPPGKIAQVYRLSFPNSYYPISLYQTDTLEPVHPLLSQPVIELCLRVRTYALVSGATDRTAARKAFEHVLPPGIASRRSKGGVNDHGIDVLLRNVCFVREFLLEGELMRHHMLNRSVLEDALGGKREGLSVAPYMIIDLLQVEAWLRAWTTSWSDIGTTVPSITATAP